MAGNGLFCYTETMSGIPSIGGGGMDFDPSRRQPSPPPSREEKKDKPGKEEQPAEERLTREEIERRKREIRERLMKERRDRGEPGGLLDEYA